MLERKDTAAELFDTLEFRDIQDEITGPMMTGVGDCSTYCTHGSSCTTSGSSCVTNAYCNSQIGCSTRSGCIGPAPGMRKKK